MPNNQAFTSALRAVVAREVETALAPYRDMLTALIEFSGEAPARGGPGRPERSPVAEKPGRKRRGRKAKTSEDLASAFTEGQKVQYRQGRGTFDATVIEIDASRGVLRLERDRDAKKVVRPASKVIAA
jgi:sRNA-binding protein